MHTHSWINALLRNYDLNDAHAVSYDDEDGTSYDRYDDDLNEDDGGGDAASSRLSSVTKEQYDALFLNSFMSTKFFNNFAGLGAS